MTTTTNKLITGHVKADSRGRLALGKFDVEMWDYYSVTVDGEKILLERVATAP